MTKKETNEWAIQVRLPISAKEWLDQRAKRHHRSKIGELRTIIHAAMAPDLALVDLKAKEEAHEIAKVEAHAQAKEKAHESAKEAAADAEPSQAAEVYSETLERVYAEASQRFYDEVYGEAYAKALKKSHKGAL